ncbi:MAG TPA: hypothetical protein VNS61_16285 [Caldimonas sp.]|nr:hypothetical protein [Caldimonas sp.]
MGRPLVLAIAASAAIFAATAAQAAPVSWSVGISVPPFGAVIAPAYPGYAGYAPAPRLIVEPAPYYAPRPRVWLPPLPVWTGNDRWRDGGHGGWHDRREDWRNDRHDGRDGNDRRNGRGHDDGRSHDGRDHDGHLGRVVWR